GARQRRAADERPAVDGDAGELAHRRRHLVVEVRGLPALQAQALPVHGEHAGCDGAAGDARDLIELWQVVELIETLQGTEMEEHRAITAAREAERDTRARRPVIRGIGLDEANRRLTEHHATILARLS